MDFKQLLSVVQKWAWLLILGLVLGAAGGVVFSKIQSPVYEASTKVLITRAPQTTSAPQSIMNDQLLTATYTQLLAMRPVLNEASAKLGFNISKDNIQVKVITDTQIVQVIVSDQDPERSALIANTIVEVSLEQYSELQNGRYTAAEKNIQAQIDSVQSQITDLLAQIDQISTSSLETQKQQVQAQMQPLQDEVNKLQQEIATLTPPISSVQKAKIAEDQARINEITPLLSLYQQIYTNLVVLNEPVPTNNAGSNQITNLQSTVSLYRQVYTNLLSNLESVRLAKLQNTSNATQIEPAVTPKKPVRPVPLLYTFISGISGMVLAMGATFLIEYLDESIENADDIRRFLGVPVIGYIGEVRKNRKEKEKIMVAMESQPWINDPFRALKTNLEFACPGKQTRTILVTSPNQADGKSSIAANLAVVFAREGKRVLLLDADMRQPSLHHLFNIPNRAGLADMLNRELDVDAAGRSWKKFGNLKLIPSGQVTSESIDLLGSEKMQQIFKDLEKTYDTVLIDTPPCFVADAQVLADKVDAVVLVIRPGHTHRNATVAALEQFKQVGANVAGVVLNRTRQGIHPSHSRYYSPTPGATGKHAGSRRKKVSFPRLYKIIANVVGRGKKTEQNTPPGQ